MKAQAKNLEMKMPWLLALLATMVVFFSAGNALAACYATQTDATAAGATTVRIYGSIYTGGMDAITGAPLPAPGAGSITGGTVMVQNMHHGGPFECYAPVTGNAYEAFVPVDEEYVVMYGAPGHDITSREFTVPVGATADMQQDAFLPPRDLVTGELPRANALMYAHLDNYVNSEDDYPDDPPLPGTHFYVFDDDGNFEQDGIAGSQTPADMPAMFGPDITGLYYFKGLKTGEHKVMALPPGVSPQIDPTSGDPVMNCSIDPTTSGWFWLTSEEGTQCWEIVLRPNDPGTELGAYLSWFSMVEHIGQLPPFSPPPDNPAAVDNTASISGVLWDADGTDVFEIIDPHEVPQVCDYEHQGTLFIDFTTGYHPENGRKDPLNPGEDCVWPNINMDRGYAILWDSGNIKILATTLADPVTGAYQFDNVPPGNYKIYSVDWPNDYIWQEMQVTVLPSTDVTAADFFIPRFFARLNGHVVNDTTGTNLNGVTVNLRTKDGGVWKSEVTADGTSGVNGEPILPGYFNFNELSEIEVMAHVDVDYHDLPANLRGVIDTETLCYDDPNSTTVPPAQICGNYDLSTRDIGWFTSNYRTNLHVEEIPATEGYIIGVVFNDHLTYDAGTSTWTSNGLLDEKEDRLFANVTVNLLDSFGAVVATTTTGDFSTDRAVAQGHIRPYSPKGFILTPEPPYNVGDLEVDEWGGIFKGPRFGQYEFRGVVPGNYTVQLVVPAGFSPVPLASDSQNIAVIGGQRNDVDFGVNTLVPLAGEIEGGIFDDVFIDNEHQSILWMEKQGLPHVPVGIYDHLGYKLGQGFMGHPYCYLPQPPASIGGRICPATEELGQKPEVERRAAPGVHIYFGNDPSLPGYKSDYVPLALNYTFGQGQFKFEADWSHLPVAFVEAPGAAPVLPALPANAPIIAGGAPQAMNNVPADGKGVFKPAVFYDTDQLDIQLTAQKNKKNWKMLSKNKKFNKESLRRNKKARERYRAMKKGLIGQQCVKNRAKGKNGVIDDSGLFTIPYVLDGVNFGKAKGHATVSLSGQQLRVESWSDTQVIVRIPRTAVPGSLIIATTNGISNSIKVDPTVIAASAQWQAYLAARTLYVDAAAAVGTGDGSEASPFATITEAMNNLPVERPVYVMVAAGTYNENVRIAESDIKIIGAGPFESMIDGLRVDTLNPIGVSQQGVYAGSAGPTFYIGVGGVDGAVNNVTISGFSITGGTPGIEGPGAGIFSDYGNTNIDINNNIMGRNGGEYGGAIWMHHSNHDVRIWSNQISENGSFGGYSGGISINDEPEYGHEDPVLDHSYDDQLYSTPPGTYEIFNNLLFRNYSPDYGGAMALYEVKDHLKIYGNTIMENWSDDHGGGMFFEDTGPVDVYDNVILRNYSSDDGGAISFEDVGDDISIVKIYNNVIAENIADDRSENTARGGALAFDDTLQAEVYNNTITGNIVAGTYDPTGGAIDSERHGHEYDAASTAPKPPYFSDVKVYNNIIWDNWRLKYEITFGEDLTYTSGINYQWTIDNIHVDDPAVNQPWETDKNADSLSYVEYNDMNGVSSGTNGGQRRVRANNIYGDPMFVNPAALDWHIQGSASPAINKALFSKAPVYDIDLIDRTTDCRADMGAFEHRTTPRQVIRIPSELLGIIEIPVPGSTKLHPDAP